MLTIKRDRIASNTKKRLWPRNKTIGGTSPSSYFKEGDVPRILKKHDISMVKNVILDVNEPSLYGSNLRHLFTIEGSLLALTSHDH